MAIDQSVPLGGKSFSAPAPTMMDWANHSMKLAQMGQQMKQSEQEIEASKASQALTEAQTPGVAAESEQKQRGLAYINWETANKKKFVKPDGTVDTNAYVNEASNNGFGDYAAKVATSDLTRTSDQIKNSKSQAEADAYDQEYQQKLAAHAATLIAAAPEKDRPAMLRKVIDGAEAVRPGSGKYVFSLFGTQDDKGTVGVDVDRLNAVRTATMTPQQQKEKELAERGVVVSERAQALAEETASIPYKKAVEDITPSGEKVGGFKNAAQADQYAARLQNGLKAIDERQLFEYISRPGNVVAEVWNKYIGQNPAARQLQDSIDSYNAAHPNSEPLTIRDGSAAIKRLLSNEHTTTKNWANKNRQLATKGTVSEAANSETPPNEAPVKEAAPGGEVTMFGKDGRSYRIPANEVERAKASGLKATR